MDRTLDYYDNNAPGVTRNYEQVDFSRMTQSFSAHVRSGGRIIDIGSGSGRDAAMLFSMGYDVIILDGSREMLRSAIALHPQLKGRELLCALPGPIPCRDGQFDGACSWAVLMHLDTAAIQAAFLEISRILKPGGVFAYSANTQRSGLDADGNDSHRRHFTCLKSGQWEDMHRNAGFSTLEGEETNDITGRAGVRWVSFITRKVGSEPQHS